MPQLSQTDIDNYTKALEINKQLDDMIEHADGPYIGDTREHLICSANGWNYDDYCKYTHAINLTHAFLESPLDIKNADHQRIFNDFLQITRTGGLENIEYYETGLFYIRNRAAAISRDDEFNNWINPWLDGADVAGASLEVAGAAVNIKQPYVAVGLAAAGGSIQLTTAVARYFLNNAKDHQQLDQIAGQYITLIMNHRFAEDDKLHLLRQMGHLRYLNNCSDLPPNVRQRFTAVMTDIQAQLQAKGIDEERAAELANEEVAKIVAADQFNKDKPNRIKNLAWIRFLNNVNATYMASAHIASIAGNEELASQINVVGSSAVTMMDSLEKILISGVPVEAPLMPYVAILGAIAQVVGLFRRRRSPLQALLRAIQCLRQLIHDSEERIRQDIAVNRRLLYRQELEIITGFANVRRDISELKNLTLHFYGALDQRLLDIQRKIMMGFKELIKREFYSKFAQAISFKETNAHMSRQLFDDYYNYFRSESGELVFSPILTRINDDMSMVRLNDFNPESWIGQLEEYAKSRSLMLGEVNLSNLYFLTHIAKVLTKLFNDFPEYRVVQHINGLKPVVDAFDKHAGAMQALRVGSTLIKHVLEDYKKKLNDIIAEVQSLQDKFEYENIIQPLAKSICNEMEILKKDGMIAQAVIPVPDYEHKDHWKGKLRAQLKGHKKLYCPEQASAYGGTARRVKVKYEHYAPLYNKQRNELLAQMQQSEIERVITQQKLPLFGVETEIDTPIIPFMMPAVGTKPGNKALLRLKPSHFKVLLPKNILLGERLNLGIVLTHFHLNKEKPGLGIVPFLKMHGQLDSIKLKQTDMQIEVNPDGAPGKQFHRESVKSLEDDDHSLDIVSRPIPPIWLVWECNIKPCTFVTPRKSYAWSKGGGIFQLKSLQDDLASKPAAAPLAELDVMIAQEIKKKEGEAKEYIANKFKAGGHLTKLCQELGKLKYLLHLSFYFVYHRRYVCDDRFRYFLNPDVGLWSYHTLADFFGNHQYEGAEQFSQKAEEKIKQADEFLHYVAENTFDLIRDAGLLPVYAAEEVDDLKALITQLEQAFADEMGAAGNATRVGVFARVGGIRRQLGDDAPIPRAAQRQKR